LVDELFVLRSIKVGNLLPLELYTFEEEEEEEEEEQEENDKNDSDKDDDNDYNYNRSRKLVQVRTKLPHGSVNTKNQTNASATISHHTPKNTFLCFRRSVARSLMCGIKTPINGTLWSLSGSEEYQ